MDIQNSDITLTTSCKTTQGGQAMNKGIYTNIVNGAPIVRVSAVVDYSPVIGSAFGFSGVSLKLNASQEAAVMGI